MERNKESSITTEISSTHQQLSWETPCRCGCGTEGLQLKTRHDLMYNKGLWIHLTDWIQKDYPTRTMQTLRTNKNWAPFPFQTAHQYCPDWVSCMLLLQCPLLQNIDFEILPAIKQNRLFVSGVLLHIQTQISRVWSSNHRVQPKPGHYCVGCTEKQTAEHVLFISKIGETRARLNRGKRF